MKNNPDQNHKTENVPAPQRYPTIPLIPQGSQQNAPVADMPTQGLSGTLPQTVPRTVPREGSTLYYSLLHVPDKVREDVCNILILLQTLADALTEVQEPSVAEKKIHWWHEEIDRLINHQPRHPATQQALLSLTTGIESDAAHVKQKLLAILAANNNDKYQNSTDMAAFEQRLIADYGARLDLVSTVLGVSSTRCSTVDLRARPEMFSALALGLGLYDRLRQSHKLHYRGYPVWPDSLYSEHGLEPAQLSDSAQTAATRHLFGSIMERTAHELDTALTHLPITAETSAPACLPIYINTHLRQRQLQLWQQKQCNPVQMYVTLTPIQKAWSSWRAKTRFNKVAARHKVAKTGQS